MPSHAEDIKKAVEENKVLVYSKTFCPYSKMAKESLQDFSNLAPTCQKKVADPARLQCLGCCQSWVGASYHLIELDLRDDIADYQDALQKVTGVRSVPQVFVKGKFIGGGTDVKKLKESGELAKLVA